MKKAELLEIVERYSRTNEPEAGTMKVVRIADQKTIIIEHFEGTGRSFLLSEYKVDGKTYWAGYSSRSQTVYIALGA